MNKLTSRKFWVCVAAMLASIATSIAGIHSNNPTVIAIGTICGIISAAIYAFCEAWVDAKAVDTKANAQAMFQVMMDEFVNSQVDEEEEE